jgi:hypothetical protein
MDHPPHLPLAHFLTYCHPFPIGQGSPLGLLHNLLSFRGSLIALMMEAICTSETSVNIYLTTWQYIPEEPKLHTRRRENLKSHMYLSISYRSLTCRKTLRHGTNGFCSPLAKVVLQILSPLKVIALGQV